MKSLKQAGIDTKRFEFKAASSTPASKYKWDAIFDGGINVIAKGEDYEVETEAMLPKLKTAARRRYKTVKVSRRDHNGKLLEDMIIVQAFDMTPDERTAEDAKRADEKTKFKAKQAAKKAAGETVDDDATEETDGDESTEE